MTGYTESGKSMRGGRGMRVLYYQARIPAVAIVSHASLTLTSFDQMFQFMARSLVWLINH
jgi:hypothetical protein